MAKRKFVGGILELTRENHRDAAIVLGIHPAGMRRFLDRLGM